MSGASVVALVEALQHGGVGPLKQPLLARGAGLARVHEDPPLARAAVDAAVADRVVQAFVLEETEERSLFTFCCRCCFYSHTTGLTDNIGSRSDYGDVGKYEQSLLLSVADIMVSNEDYVAVFVGDFRRSWFYFFAVAGKRPNQSISWHK